MITGSALVSLLVAIVVFGLIFYYLIPLLPPPFNVVAQIVMVIILILWLLQTFVPSYRVIGINDPFPGQHLVLGDGGTAGQQLALNEGINFNKDGGTVHYTGSEVILAALPKCRSKDTI